MDLIALFDDYESAAIAAIEQADSAAAIEEVRILYLGKKKGRLKDLQSSLSKATPEERPVVGKRFNEVKNRVSQRLDERKVQLAAPVAARGADFDVTLPGTKIEMGRPHPITQTIIEFKDLMGRFGFSVVDGPEIEDEWHNFDALNIPLEHPARDPLDNFYLAAASANSDAKGGPRLLRSQTSTVQIRTMEHTQPPVRVVSLGRVYRPDTIDKTHSCMFHQMEGLMVGESVTMAQLKTVLLMFAQAYLGDDVDIRFRPSFFPFTEPSVEVDMKWGDDWLEVGGAGMVDPNVLRAVNYDPEQVTGFAFGLGIERFCMKRHEIDDIRRFYENDIRFLSQF
ncbi:MAG: phenylalanine--tRNA ligase subunit alpha [Planctomycetota bacterium]|nr:phenylalanine--tRNA ligase subunit alpha [Planctomycetota bacterium]